MNLVLKFFDSCDLTLLDENGKLFADLNISKTKSKFGCCLWDCRPKNKIKSHFNENAPWT